MTSSISQNKITTNNKMLPYWKSTNVGACLGGGTPSLKLSHVGPTPGPGSRPRQLFAALWDLLQLWGHQSGPRTRPWCLRCRHLHEGAPPRTAAAFLRGQQHALHCTGTALALLLKRSGRDIHSSSSTLAECGRGAKLLVLLPA